MKEKISFEDFKKLDLRVGKILDIEDIDGADKLYKFTIGLGKEIGKRTKKVVVLTNLEPRKLKGIVSEGMILAACSEDDSEIIFIAPERDIEEGSVVR